MTGSSDLTSEQVVERARELLGRRRDRENLALLADAVERFPEHAEIRLLYATALLPFRPEEAPWEAAMAIKLDPDDPVLLTRAASLMFYMDEIDTARSYATRASQIAPPGFIFESELISLGGKLAAMEGDHQLAEEALRAAVEAEPEQESYARELAAFLADRGRRAEALAVVDEALAVAHHRDKLMRLRKELASDP